jgi:hypothetical protein
VCVIIVVNIMLRVMFRAVVCTDKVIYILRQWETVNRLGRNRNIAIGPDGARKQKLLCWRRPAVNYSSAVNRQAYVKCLCTNYI